MCIKHDVGTTINFDVIYIYFIIEKDVSKDSKSSR